MLIFDTTTTYWQQRYGRKHKYDLIGRFEQYQPWFLCSVHKVWWRYERIGERHIRTAMGEDQSSHRSHRDQSYIIHLAAANNVNANFAARSSTDLTAGFYQY